MITVISGTNRVGSRTLQVAQFYLNELKEKNQNAKLFSLEDLRSLKRDESIISLEKNLLIPTRKFIIVMPEYNGSFPGVLKVLFDVTDIKKCWWHKKALLVGVADGRGGNLRGLEHMTNILHYLKMNVHYNKLPISRINDEMTDVGEFKKSMTLQAIDEQINDFILY